jgi:VIT1/CCC1 family predicted Fe2+/Mn2+ transporter
VKEKPKSDVGRTQAKGQQQESKSQSIDATIDFFSSILSAFASIFTYVSFDNYVGYVLVILLLFISLTLLKSFFAKPPATKPKKKKD